MLYNKKGMRHRIASPHRGFIQLIIIIVLSVTILSLLGISISSFINNTTLRDNFALLWHGVTWIWQQYIIAPYLQPVINVIRGIF